MRSSGAVYGRVERFAAGSAALLAAALVVTGCKNVHVPADGAPSGSAAATSDDARAVSPLDNPDGTKPGLAAITSAADRAKARALIDKVATKGRGPKTGYDRDEFGYAWMDSAPTTSRFAHNGCDTRNDLLKRDGEKVKFRSGSDCVVVSMTLYDPYTGKTIDWTKAQADQGPDRPRHAAVLRLADGRRALDEGQARADRQRPAQPHPGRRPDQRRQERLGPGRLAAAEQADPLLLRGAVRAGVAEVRPAGDGRGQADDAEAVRAGWQPAPPAGPGRSASCAPWTASAAAASGRVAAWPGRCRSAGPGTARARRRPSPPGAYAPGSRPSSPPVGRAPARNMTTNLAGSDTGSGLRSMTPASSSEVRTITSVVRPRSRASRSSTSAATCSALVLSRR